MNTTLLIRLALAKTFLNKAENSLKQGGDELSLATAVVNIHDCIDNFLGVLSSELHAETPQKDYMNNRFLEVSKKYKEKYDEILPNESDIALLNTMRNGVKHSGVIPSSTQIIGLVNNLTDFANTVCEKVFGLKLLNVSLIAQVNNIKKRQTLEAIEKEITEHNFKGAMIKSAKALFEFHDSQAPNMSGILEAIARIQSGGKFNKSNIFPENDVQYISLKLLGVGIDPYLYYRVRNLVPKVGYDNLADKKLIYEYASGTWHEKNWTAENATFCLNFLTKLFIGQQRNYDGYNIVTKQVLHEVIFIRDSDVLMGIGDTKTTKKFVKGNKLEGLVDGYINDELIGYRKGLPDRIELTEIDGENSKYEKYLIFESDIEIKTIGESFKGLDI